MNGKHWRYWLLHDSSSDAFQLIMLFSGAPQTLGEGEPAYYDLLRGSTVMGKKGQSLSSFSQECFRGGREGLYPWAQQSQRAMDVTPQVVSMNDGEKVAESQSQLPKKPTFHHAVFLNNS